MSYVSMAASDPLVHPDIPEAPAYFDLEYLQNFLRCTDTPAVVTFANTVHAIILHATLHFHIFPIDGVVFHWRRHIATDAILDLSFSFVV